ncbi:hypothetical protein [Tsukamurella ocularis]|uniref:hypothetical protein n=1 Tax=Tsukamurella ocularis TaxID=1970234 RepID=UPI002168FAE7|nr:hypothetical protein [Tsukamurella ocularis]MCS3781588.1 ABC-type siderophore export system fused ATPase/permease subunit [Tsukamurella ocularis]MCS3787960.1 ABC-type siderophore export system fused ATPase/permease subunit [Tsukamurella ocularis]MCS3851255.1 ABC-type siderophore export system fused ATPase/permease subunit [Tsukamurella ocularis]
MTGTSFGARTQRLGGARVGRMRTLVSGRQTRADIVVSMALLVASFTATILNLALAVRAMPSIRECAAMACTYTGTFDVLAIAFLTSLLLGTTFGAHAVLNLLNRRIAWGYALLDALVSFGCLFGGLAFASTF